MCLCDGQMDFLQLHLSIKKNLFIIVGSRGNLLKSFLYFIGHHCACTWFVAAENFSTIALRLSEIVIIVIRMGTIFAMATVRCETLTNEQSLNYSELFMLRLVIIMTNQ